MENKLKEKTESRNYKNPEKGEPIERTYSDRISNTKYIIWACYIEEGADGKIKVVGDISYWIYKTMPDATLNGEFTVDKNGKKVHFNHGNLEKTAAGNYRTFDNQWEYRCKYSNTSTPDLFQWDVTNTFNTNSKWFVLSFDEWKYIFFDRTDANKLFALATLNIDDKNIHGIILLPDKWEEPDGIHVRTANEIGLDRTYETSPRYEEKFEDYDAYAQNTFNQTKWETLELAGAVFLPGIFTVQNYGLGEYWSTTTESEENYAKYVYFSKGMLALDNGMQDKEHHLAIRPVRIVD
jgi:hypothetical protein